MDSKFNAVGIIAAAGPFISGLAFLLPIFSFRENRQVQGQDYFAIDVIPPVLFLICIGILILYIFFSYKSHLLYIQIFASLLLIFIFLIISYGPIYLNLELSKISRVALGPGFWIFVSSIFLPLYINKSKYSMYLILIPIAFLSLGLLSEIGILKEFAIKQKKFGIELINHIRITLTSVGIAAFIAIPTALFVHRWKNLKSALLSITAFFQTIPGLALLGLLIAPLAWLSTHIPFLRLIGIKGIGDTPGIIAVSLYALFPILHNSLVSLDVLPKDAIIAGRAMGMSNFQLLHMVELPLAVPLILGGIRIALVQAIGNTTLVALVGGGGLGNFVFQGLDQGASDLILLGVFPILGLTLFAEYSLQFIEKKIKPAGADK